MARFSPLRGREMPDHKYVKREWLNGKWKYTYKSDVTGDQDSTSDASDGTATDYINKGPSEKWVDAYYERKNRKSTVTPNSSAKAAGKSRAAARGRDAASNYIDTSVMRAKTTTVDASDAAYNESMEKLKTETENSRNQTETYYKQKYEEEKNNYRNKLTAALEKKYGSDIPESELTRLNSQVEEYSRSLWNDVYKPMADRVNKSHQQNAEQITRYLKKLYDKK